MKTYAPKHLHGSDFRQLMQEMSGEPKTIAKFLHVSERCVWRWLKDDSCPWPNLALMWHETPTGRETAHLDTGNNLNIQRGLARANGDALAFEKARLARVLSISDTGAANEPLLSGPLQLGRVGPLRFHPIAQRGELPDDSGCNDGTAQHNQTLSDNFRDAG